MLINKNQIYKLDEFGFIYEKKTSSVNECQISFLFNEFEIKN